GIIAKAVSDGHRLITLVGAGGVGKTRLAVRHAEMVAAAGSLRVGFCDLTAAQGADGMVAAIACALDVPLVGAQATDGSAQLGRALSAQGPTLLVLDNLETVGEQAHPIVRALLDATLTTTLLVTSRERLRLQGELVVRVDALPLPGEDSPDDAAALR